MKKRAVDLKPGDVVREGVVLEVETSYHKTGCVVTTRLPCGQVSSISTEKDAQYEVEVMAYSCGSALESFAGKDKGFKARNARRSAR